MKTMMVNKFTNISKTNNPVWSHLKSINKQKRPQDMTLKHLKVIDCGRHENVTELNLLNGSQTLHFLICKIYVN